MRKASVTKVSVIRGAISQTRKAGPRPERKGGALSHLPPSRHRTPGNTKVAPAKLATACQRQRSLACLQDQCCVHMHWCLLSKKPGTGSWDSTKSKEGRHQDLLPDGQELHYCWRDLGPHQCIQCESWKRLEDSPVFQYAIIDCGHTWTKHERPNKLAHNTQQHCCPVLDNLSTNDSTPAIGWHVCTCNTLAAVASRQQSCVALSVTVQQSKVLHLRAARTDCESVQEGKYAPENEHPDVVGHLALSRQHEAVSDSQPSLLMQYMPKLPWAGLGYTCSHGENETHTRRLSLRSEVGSVAKCTRLK